MLSHHTLACLAPQPCCLIAAVKPNSYCASSPLRSLTLRILRTLRTLDSPVCQFTICSVFPVVNYTAPVSIDPHHPREHQRREAGWRYVLSFPLVFLDFEVLQVRMANPSSPNLNTTLLELETSSRQADRLPPNLLLHLAPLPVKHPY